MTSDKDVFLSLDTCHSSLFMLWKVMALKAQLDEHISGEDAFIATGTANADTAQMFERS